MKRTDAHDQQYLESARWRLKDDPDYEDVLRDLEQSIGEKVAAQLHSGEQVINRADVKTVLSRLVL
jgi:phage shock protein C